MRITILLFALFVVTNIQGQIDSLRIIVDDDLSSTSIIINKGRKSLLDNFIENNKDEVIKIRRYLAGVEKEGRYYGLYTYELWYLLYWTQEYEELADSIADYDAKNYSSDNTISPIMDELFNELELVLWLERKKIQQQIADADLDEETRVILMLQFQRMILNRPEQRGFEQDSINSMANAFMEKYPESRYFNYARNNLKYELVPKKWGFAVEFFSGYGILTQDLADNYTNIIPVGVAFDICYKRFELYLRDYIGFNKAGKDIQYSSGTWEKGSASRVFLPEASLGYAVADHYRYKIAPFGGIASMNIGPTQKALNDTPDLDEVDLKFTMTYVVGFQFDFKFGPKSPNYSPKTNYGFIRIRYTWNFPGFDWKYGLPGNFHSITIGGGGFTRKTERKY